MSTFNATSNGPIDDGGTYGNASPGTAGVDFPGVADTCDLNGHALGQNADYACAAMQDTAGGGSFWLIANLVCPVIRNVHIACSAGPLAIWTGKNDGSGGGIYIGGAATGEGLAVNYGAEVTLYGDVLMDGPSVNGVYLNGGTFAWEGSLYMQGSTTCTGLITGSGLVTAWVGDINHNASSGNGIGMFGGTISAWFGDCNCGPSCGGTGVNIYSGTITAWYGDCNVTAGTGVSGSTITAWVYFTNNNWYAGGMFGGTITQGTIADRITELGYLPQFRGGSTSTDPGIYNVLWGTTYSINGTSLMGHWAPPPQYAVLEGWGYGPDYNPIFGTMHIPLPYEVLAGVFYGRSMTGTLAALTMQNVADALLLAPSSGTPASGSVMDRLDEKISDLQTHGDTSWATATGFATPTNISDAVTTIGLAIAAIHSGGLTPTQAQQLQWIFDRWYAPVTRNYGAGTLTVAHPGTTLPATALTTQTVKTTTARGTTIIEVSP